jgi:hypothetical protein
MKITFVTTFDRNILLAAACVTGMVACAVSLPAQPPSAPASADSGGHPFQKIQMPTAAEVAKAWVNPPAEYGPEPYFGMNGPVTIESLAHDLDTMKALGFHAVTAQAGGGMSTTYLSPEYFAFFKQFALEAKKRDMKVWIVDDIGYPSGFGGGIFAAGGPAAKDKHDLSMQALSIAQRLPIAAGASLKQSVGADVVSATALSSSGSRLAVPIASGSIDWTAPAGDGDWTVLLVSHVFRTSPTRSDANPTHAKDSSNPLEDYLNPAATAAWIEATHNGYYKVMPELFGTTILGFRGDEPDYSIAGLPWTPVFFDTFQRVKGYDIRPYLGALLLSQGGGRARPPAAAPGAVAAPQSDPAFIPAGPPMPPAKLTDAELRAKGDYYDVFSQMFRDGFFKPQGVWCAEHGVSYQVHLNHEEMEMDLTRSEGDFIRDMKYVEEPGIDAIWHQIWTDTVSDYPRLAASAAHIYGHPQSFTESFAAYRPAPDITQARYILNEQLVRGINVMETMNYSATRPASAAPAADPPAPPTTAGAPAAAPPRRGGPSAVMRDPGFPALADYVRRVGYVMSMGRPGASVALYLPSSSMWLNDRDADTAFVATEQMLSERQIDFDIINQDALATDLKPGLDAASGYLETMSGNAYRTVIIPSAMVLTQTELDRLRTFAKGGGRVLFLGATPSIISGKTILDARAATPADFDFATVETSAQLPPTPTPPAQAPSSPPGPQIVPPAIEAALNKVIPRRAVTLDAPDTALKVNTRYLEDARVYLFFNEGAQPVSHTVTLSAGGSMKVEAWDPATGAVAPMAATPRRGSVTVKLDLKPYETKLITIK